ncbi:hypothetical protein [Burkholderia pseudomallei]|jgi:hypothetical protein|uniref:hypothetical protein n=1 Tax=Burkholderia pseudomallei TaxID=28450 RepID=UPI0024DFF040|nr:hypothetical protein [Burkholderia pseudomallei]
MEIVKFKDYSGDEILMYTTPTGNVVVAVGSDVCAASILMPFAELLSMVKQLEKEYYGDQYAETC